MEVVKKFSLEYADVVIYDNGIFHSHIFSKVPLNLDQVKEIYAIRISNMGNKKSLMLSTGEDRYLVPSQEALEFLQSKDRTLSVKADAFVIKSFSQRLFIKTANNLRKSAAPVSFFATNAKAIKWLKSI